MHRPSTVKVRHFATIGSRSNYGAKLPIGTRQNGHQCRYCKWMLRRDEFAEQREVARPWMRVGAETISSISRDYLAPETADSMYQQKALFLQFKRAAQTMDAYSVKSDLLRRTAESKVQMGEAFPEASASVPRMQTAALPRLGLSLPLIRMQGNLGSPCRSSTIEAPIRLLRWSCPTERFGGGGWGCDLWRWRRFCGVVCEP